jgi:integrin beta 3/collagen type V/XI/XXIV/XXVII alpha
LANSLPKLEIQGSAPFKQSGIYEVQIAITEKKPTDSSITSKNFETIWKDDFHLQVKNGQFSEILGSDKNPLPDSILKLDTIWVVVTDQFSSLHSVFDVKISAKLSAPKKAEKLKTTISRPETISYVQKRPSSEIGKRLGQGTPGLQGGIGPLGPQGQPGEKGPKGDKGITGDQGDKGDKGEKGPTGSGGDKGNSGQIGQPGDKGILGPSGKPGDKGPPGPHGLDLRVILVHMVNLVTKAFKVNLEKRAQKAH